MGEFARLEGIDCGRTHPSDDMRRILFVCHGSICRSTAAELILKALVKARGVADPWHTGDFEQTFQNILAGCEAMLRLEI